MRYRMQKRTNLYPFCMMDCIERGAAEARLHDFSTVLFGLPTSGAALLDRNSNSTCTRYDLLTNDFNAI